MENVFIQQSLHSKLKYCHQMQQKGKHDLKMPKFRRHHLSLSDIIEATIGDEIRSSEQPDSSDSSQFNLDFLESICESQQETINDDPNFLDKFDDSNQLLGENCVLGCDIQTGENSNNASDMFQYGVGVSETSEMGPTEELSFSIATKIGFHTEIDFLVKDVQLTKTGESSESKEYIDASETNGSFDSDLEDSMHFVDPEDQNQPEPEFPLYKQNTEVQEPMAKKPRICNSDHNSCPPKLYDCNPEFLALVQGDINLHNPIEQKQGQPTIAHRSRSFSGNIRPGLTRQKSQLNLNQKNKLGQTRSRSFSEFCPREDEFSTLSSLLEGPENDFLSKHPFFKDLKSTLLSDCQNKSCPQTLFDTLTGNGPKQDVYARERNMQVKFSSLQHKYPDEVSELSTFFHQQSAEIQTERLKEVHDEKTPKSYRNYLNNYYDNQLHMIMDRVEQSLGVLSVAKREFVVGCRTFKSRPLLSRKAVAMMEEWYMRNYEHPYPSNTAVEALATAGQISAEQVKKWFANKRNRSKNTKPVVEVANMKRKRQFSARW
ncbi:uncharacterized protein LOC127836540 [Dreissena polymorpha]|uniref:Homeobox domain-containing protein n=1 Tax=Dreissena polymorpha TaxID=45954 RepID=A0A9D4MYL6_DREPO|nr:uncharacterized protein LOC127836540 [Dreissena polymorpha]KAH3884139.1 hypothetical protein DPMN_008111 [Dreissena polymorpha]